MKIKALLICIVSVVAAMTYAGPVGTAFTYQGQLTQSGTPANGNYDFTFNLYNTNSLGTPLTSPVFALGIGVTNGLFDANLDFGSQFNGEATWLEISVRSNNVGNFIILAPRQQLTPIPNAVFAVNAGNATTASNVTGGSVTGAGIATATITAANIASGQVVKSLNGLEDAVTLAQGNNVTITPNGNTLTIAASGGTQEWSLTGNPGTTAGTDFLGTTDNQPLELWVNSQRALRLEPTSGPPNVISGSSANTTVAGAEGSSIGGGEQNVQNSGAYDCIIGGGRLNTNSGDYNCIEGGYYNMIQYYCRGSTISGGEQNVIQGSSSDSIIAGGVVNQILTGAQYCTISGGSGNTVQGNNSYYCTISGGGYNSIQTNANYAAISGGFMNLAGGFCSLAGGSHAQATNDGAFVWGDRSSSSTVSSTVPNQFIVRASGGVQFYSNPNPLTGVALNPGSTSWSTISDKNAKKNFRHVDGEAVLAKLASMPVEKWNYKWESDTNTPHIGPMAQDFKAAFYPGRDDKSISTLEFDGVELAAIQGLNQKLTEKESEIQELKQSIGELKKLVQTLAEKK